MKILIIGNGGREHALAWKVAQSPLVIEVWVAPGNAGTALEPKCQNIPIEPTDVAALLAFAQEKHIHLTIVGPETPLLLGITDAFAKAGLHCFGPSAKAAQLEGSKAFCKDFLKRHHIPTADYETFTSVAKAQAYVAHQSLPIVIKASQLASGKGVIIAHSMKEAFDTLQQMFDGSLFGKPVETVVIEQFLTGQELSFIALVDGQHVLPLATSQDHKTRDNGDRGPNTGGMGAYSPVPWVTPSLEQTILKTVMIPTVQGMQEEHAPFSGFLYAGLMISPQGDIRVLEFNCRLGDPETQPLLMRMKSDLIPLLLSTFTHDLHTQQIEWHSKTAVGVVLASHGYPGPFIKDREISVPASIPEHTKIFHAGTKLSNNSILTNGGRVLCVTALGDGVAQAQEHAYETARKVDFDGVFYRTDIGDKAKG